MLASKSCFTQRSAFPQRRPRLNNPSPHKEYGHIQRRQSHASFSQSSAKTRLFSQFWVRHGLTEPRALSWELGFHLACGKPTYQVLTGAESRTTEVAEPNWMESLLKEFGDTTIWWPHIPALDPSSWFCRNEKLPHSEQVAARVQCRVVGWPKWGRPKL